MQIECYGKGKIIFMKIKALKTEYLTNPISVPLERVRFSWSVESTERNQYQSAYQILVQDEKGIVWDSEKVLCNDMAGICYAGQPLRPRTKYGWQVKVWNQSGECSEFSEMQSFETTLSSGEWKGAEWIGANTTGLPLFRKAFALEKEIKEARVYVSGLGVYELTVNGKAIGEEILGPMVTRYHKRYFYNAYDIVTLLKKGENVFGIMLGNGYYCMHDNGVDWQKTKWTDAPWADEPKCKIVAFITYTDGSVVQICTDESWKNAESPIRVDEAYYGEEYDARMEQKGWNQIGFDDSLWNNSSVANAPLGNAEIQLADSCKIVEELPLYLLYNAENEYLFDTKRMIVGWARITVKGQSGDEVEISYSEWLDEQGKLDFKGLLGDWNFADRKRKAQTDYYILNGEGEETFAPHFAYKGFRYVRVRTKGTVTLENITAEVIRADLPEIGGFACSDEFLNQLHGACQNALLNNLHSYPSDTPVYENMGYLADGYLTQEMAHFHYDATKYYEKWSRDILDQAKESGYIEQTAPMWDEDKENAPEWSVAIAIVPYQIYRATGDKTALVENYEKAKKVFAYQMELTDHCIATSMWGDHACAGKSTLKELSPTAYLFYTANILSETARLQGNEAEFEYYKAQVESIKEAFNARFYNEEKGYYCEYGQEEFLLNAQVLPYAMGLADEKQKERLKESVTRLATHLDGGIFAIKNLFPVLTEMGLEERLYKWVKAKTAPSWGYWLSFGDGSLWEQWYDHTRSRNHHMFGTVDEWLYKSVAGLEVIDSKTLRIKPYMAENLIWASAHTKLPSGAASCHWKKREKGIFIEVEIPFNVTVTVYIPQSSGEDKVLEIGSGKYRFEVKY